MAINDRDRGLAEKPLGGPIFLLFAGLVGAYYVWLIDPFKTRPFDPTAEVAAPRSKPPRAPVHTPPLADRDGKDEPPAEVVPEPTSPPTLADGLVRAEDAIAIESRIDPGTSVAAGDAVIWLDGAEELKTEILEVNDNVARYERRIASGVEVKATQKKLDEQLRRLDGLQQRYQKLIITAPIAGVVMMIGSGSTREAGEPLFQILPE